MTYEYIVNPVTNRKVSVFSKKGNSIIKNYLSQCGGSVGGGYAVGGYAGDDDSLRRSTSFDEVPSIRPSFTRSKTLGAVPVHDSSLANGPKFAIPNAPKYNDHKLAIPNSHTTDSSSCQGQSESSCGDDSDCIYVRRKDNKNYCRKSHNKSNGRSRSRSNSRSSSRSSSRSECSGLSNQDCPPSCKQVTTRTGKRAGQTYCRKATNRTRGRSSSRNSSRSSSSSRSRSPCSGLSNQDCPPGCKQVTTRTGKRAGQTHCRKSSNTRKAPIEDYLEGPAYDLAHDMNIQRPSKHPIFGDVCSNQSESDCGERMTSGLCRWQPEVVDRNGNTTHGHCKSSGKFGALNKKNRSKAKKSVSKCSGYANKECPPGCKKVTHTKGARKGNTHCRKA